MSIKISSTAIIREAKRIKTTPSILATKALKFKGKPDCERLVRFIKSSGEELSKVSIPNSKSLAKGMGGGGGLGDPLGATLATLMYPGQVTAGAGIGLGLGALGLGALGLGGGKMLKGTRNILSKGKSKISNAGKGIKNFFGKGGDDAVEAVAKKTAKKVGPKVAAKTAKGAVSKGLGALPLIGNLWDLGSAAYRFSKGDTIGGLLSLGSAIPVAGWGFAAIDIARDGGAFEKTPLKSKKDEEKEEKKDDNEVKKSVKQDKEPDELNRVVDKFDSVVNKYSVKGKSLGVISKAKKWFGFTEGGKVPGSGNRDTVPAMLTPGEIVMSKPAVDKIGADNLLAMNAAGGGTNRPTVSGGYNKGGVVTDPEEKKQQEDYMLKWVNKERVEFLGLPPLDKLTYGQGVELTKMMGAGPRTKEESHTDFDFDNMIKTTTKSKSVDGKTVYSGGSVGLLTEEDKQDYLASNPSARLAQDLKDQFELDNLGASISASAKMNGGGLVPAFNGGGLVQGYRGGGLIKGLGKLIKRSRDVGGSVVQSALKMAGVQGIGSNVSPPTTPGGRKVTTIAIPGGPAGESTPPPDNGGKKIPAFSASAKNSQRKIRTLGITL